MREKKNIDRLYQEKFKDFEATPNEAVWKSISARLQEKDRKKPLISPIWSRIAGVAAIFTIILLIGDWIFQVPTTPVVANEDLEENFQDDASSIAENDLSIPLGVPSEKIPYFNASKQDLATPEISEPSELHPLKNPLEAEGIKTRDNDPVVEIEQERGKKKFKKTSIFEAIKSQELEIVESTSGGNFEISTHAAPIYYGNFGKGNFLDPRFNNNNSEGEITYSYGINIAYNISEKLKIRSGISKVNMSYITNGIAYHTVAGPVAIHSVDYKSTEVQMSAGSGRSSITKQPLDKSARSAMGSLHSGILSQEMGFIEVPVELEYNLIDKKFGLNIIGGASTLFLDENKVSVNSGSVSAVGKAKNLNEISFSTNIGLGFDYDLSEKFKLNLEPMLKYQFNTFSTPTPDTQPYYLGIYSGFSFKF